MQALIHFLSGLPNEVLFLGFFVILATTTLFAFRAGKGYVYGLVAIFAVLMNIVVLKPYDLFGMTAYGGNALYGCIFFATDLLSEHHQKKHAFKAVKIGFMSLFVYFITSIVYLSINLKTDFADPAQVEWVGQVQGAFETIMTPVGGIMIASLTAYAVSNTTDVILFERFKKLTKGKHLWFRNSVATLIAQGLDTIVFSFIAVYFGIFSMEVVWSVIGFNYIFKAMIALLDTPFIYLSKLDFFSGHLRKAKA